MSVVPLFPRPTIASEGDDRPGYGLLALSALVSVLVLITMGSIVRVTGYGLGCPDWPLCYGQVVPPPAVDAWVEFTHRFLGGVAGLQIIALGVWAWRSYRHEAWVLRPALMAVGLLIVQVALGGMHVLMEIPPATGWVHTAVAMAIAGLVAVQLAATHPAAHRLVAGATALQHDRVLSRLLLSAAGATYGLILTGALVTRTGASLVCPAFPHCGSQAVMGPVLTLITIQMLHRFSAMGVALLVCVVVWRLMRASGQTPTVRRAGWALVGLVAVQFGLGVSNVWLHLPMWSRTLHLLVATLIWTGLVMLWVALTRAPQGTDERFGGA